MTSSPIYAQYTETLEGLDTIRAFHCQPQLKRENARLLVDNLRAYFCLFTANRWLGARVEAVGTGIILIIAALCVATRGSLSVGFVGLILALANNVTGGTTHTTRTTHAHDTHETYVRVRVRVRRQI